MKSELNTEAKLAIRDYMVKMIAVPGIVVSVIMFLTGFFVKDVAQKDAYVKANDTATKQIIDLTKQTSDLNSEVKFSMRECERLLQEARILKQQMETTTLYFKESRDIEEKVATSLAGRPDFLEKVAWEYNDKINESINSINTRIDQIENNSDSLSVKINDLISKTQFISVIGNRTVIDAGPNYFVVQGDGNIVVYEKKEDRLFSFTGSRWASHTEIKQ